MYPYKYEESEIRILLIDDDSLFLEIIKKFLESSGGINVTAVSDADDAVELLSGKKYDVIVSDYLMPGMDGIEFLKYVRMNHENIPFILFTGKGDKDVAIEAINNCVDYYINKNNDTEAQFKELELRIRNIASKGITEKILQRRYLFEKTISKISSRFVNFKDFREVVDKSIYDLGGFTCAERVNLFLLDNVNNIYDLTNSWVRENTAKREKIVTIPEGKISWLLTGIKERKFIYLTSCDRVPEEGRRDYEYLSDIGINSLILLPITVNNKLDGFISIENFEVSPGCTTGNMEILTVVADIFSGAIERLRKDTSLLKKNEELIASNETLSAAEEELKQQLEILLEAQRTLIESEEKYCLLFRNLNFGFALHEIITDGEGKPSDYRFVEVNPAFERLTGLKNCDIAGKTVLEVLPGTEDYWIESYGKVALTGEPLLIERYSNEISKYFSVSAYSPKPGYFATIFNDITAKKEAEESAEQLGHILENSLNEIYIFDTDTLKFQYANRGARINIGYSEEELLNMTPVDLKPEFTAEKFEEVIAPLKSGKAEYVDFITAHRRKDGSCYPVKVHLQITKSGKKEVFAAIIIDITDRVESERELDRSRFILDEALNGSRAGLWEYNAQNNIIKIQFTDTWEEILGYSPDDFPGITKSGISSELWLNLIHPDDVSYVRERLDDCINGNSGYYDTEYRMKHKSGRWIWVHARGRVKKSDADGIPQIIYGTHIDITARKNAEEALKLSNNKLKMLSEISRHDILNQITALKVYTMFSREIVSDEDVNPKLNEYLKKIEKSLNVVLNQIEFSRNYQKLGIENPKWYEVSKIIKTSITDGLSCRDNCSGLYIYADPMIEMVFNNLFENTVRHGINPSSVSVHFEPEDKCCKIIYEDDGGGISDKKKGMIFNRGFGENTGMGLFLAREILSITGITIEENGRAGSGARFEMTVPDGMWKI
ncbi:PAS domain S-box protein [Methanoplanus endosymbiosus]|uniref:histidine kinase n=1 Tax=Methanoplanus endosymbiosus TaxID=33865 RepID=A0A9E7PNH6_9EURY|nr:PAS domain S-box protein [Methanoplanus endosymbiosus]UUX93115.1 PAS domain S-box protein [Methanoplanus endosymbiosus]